MNNLNDLIRIWCLLLILVACNQDDNMDGIPDDATVPCVINSVSVIEPHKVNTRANTIDGDSIGVFLTDDVAVNGAGSTRKYSDRNNCKYTKVTGKWTPIDDENTVSLAEGVYANLWAIYPYHADKENGLDYTDRTAIPLKSRLYSAAKDLCYGKGNIMTNPTTGENLLDWGDGDRKRPYNTGTNPYNTMINDIRETTVDNLSARVYGEVKFLKDFKFTANLSIDNFTTNKIVFQTPIAGDAKDVNGRSTKESQRYFVLNTNQLLSWIHRFNSHNVDVLLGHEVKADNVNYLGARKEQFYMPGNPELNNGADIKSASSYKNDYRLEGFFGRVQYDYNDKYYLSGSYRRDGSSKFHPDNRWGNFWSAGASWRMKEESWLADVDFLTDLKLKASYGTQGNDNIGNNTPYMDQYEVVAQDGKPGGVKVWRGNKEITWEKSNNFNIGAEFGFLDRITGSVEFFIKKTTDLLYGKPLAPSEGSPNVLWVNDMDMKNTGVEVELNANIIKSNNIKWDVSLNLTHYKNEITKLATGKDPNGYATGNIWRKKGGTIYDWYMYKYAGVDSNTGEALYYRDVTDKDGNVSTTTTANPNDATRYETGKSSLPDVYGGLSTSLTAYGFDLNINTAFSIGGYVYDSGYSSLMGGGQEGSNWSTDIFGRWTPENPQATVPRVQLSTQNLSAMSDRFLTRGDYFNIKNISLGYSFPKMYTQKLGIESLRLFAVADNVWLLSKRTGLDPRQNLDGTIDYGVYAAIRTVSFGIIIYHFIKTDYRLFPRFYDTDYVLCRYFVWIQAVKLLNLVVSPGPFIRIIILMHFRKAGVDGL